MKINKIEVSSHKGCKEPTKRSDCNDARMVQEIQPFPAAGRLSDNMAHSLADLKSQLAGELGSVNSYIVRSVKLNEDGHQFEQRGSAPNFQGGVLTLCTCKHQMRSRKSAQDWETDRWIAGITSRSNSEGKHWLFYLARVQSAFESHSDLWTTLAARTRDAKAAHKNYLGDVFEPKTPLLKGVARHSPRRYVVPEYHSHRTHRSHTGWHNDIAYRHSLSGRRPPLLICDPAHTYLWDEPIIFLNQKKHCRDYAKWPSLQNFLTKLKAV